MYPSRAYLSGPDWLYFSLLFFSVAQKPKAIIVSLDAEKSFDRVEWPYLLSVLSKLNMGDGFIKWISLVLFPLCIRPHKWLEVPYIFGQGTRQGYPISPPLYAP